ncbi:uncharacterized protein LY79DRAFT_542089 [Colletotrichum navitas]|uniref:Uncharacterized protein n=1 Tax=Colletotrichum navitas TaxID=681940 RepID=A0AAD8V8M6_9PEZI|nr:uncharacterized protein LY79DRAFT_542089 [Colletotrichum navitas]KAK1597079.1 hypothetical protein LY79DRAFT_542089 [Colletotrichum navitas]
MFYLLEPPYCTPFPVPYVPATVPFFPTWVDPKTGKGTWNKVPWSPSPPIHLTSHPHPILSYPNPYQKKNPNPNPMLSQHTPGGQRPHPGADTLLLTLHATTYSVHQDGRYLLLRNTYEV